MNPSELLAYVRAAAQLLELPLDDSHASAVASHLGRTALLAQQLEQFPMALQEETSELFCPRPFPAADAGEAQP